MISLGNFFGLVFDRVKMFCFVVTVFTVDDADDSTVSSCGAGGSLWLASELPLACSGISTWGSMKAIA